MGERAARPGKIVCVGRNYREHAKELGNEVPTEPLIFLKPPSSVIGDGEAIRLPSLSRQVEHEGEIGVIIGARLSNAGETEARGAIRAIVAVNDVTATLTAALPSATTHIARTRRVYLRALYRSAGP